MPNHREYRESGQWNSEHELSTGVWRYFWFSDSIAGGGVQYIPDTMRRIIASKANAVGSLCVNGKHAPALDIDFQARLVPSRTRGHFHLYLDKQMSWRRYRILLWVLQWTGIIEKGYYKAAVRRKKTILRWDYNRWTESNAGKEARVADLLNIVEQTQNGRRR